MSQQAGSSTPMINVPYAYFYGGNMMPGGFQYHGTPAIYPVSFFVLFFLLDFLSKICWSQQNQLEILTKRIQERTQRLQKI